MGQLGWKQLHRFDSSKNKPRRSCFYSIWLCWCPRKMEDNPHLKSVNYSFCFCFCLFWQQEGGECVFVLIVLVAKGKTRTWVQTKAVFEMTTDKLFLRLVLVHSLVALKIPHHEALWVKTSSQFVKKSKHGVGAIDKWPQLYSCRPPLRPVSGLPVL